MSERRRLRESVVVGDTLEGRCLSVLIAKRERRIGVEMLIKMIERENKRCCKCLLRTLIMGQSLMDLQVTSVEHQLLVF